jgi:hypothetical protein
VTKEIADNVDQLQKLGVTKVLVNNLHPVGCTPSQTRTNNYTACDVFGNLGASVHNNNLKQVMAAKKNVHIVDLYTAFTNIVDNVPGTYIYAYMHLQVSMLLSIRFLIYGFDCVLEIDMNNFI